jgi:hypothetical protein
MERPQSLIYKTAKGLYVRIDFCWSTSSAIPSGATLTLETLKPLEGPIYIIPGSSWTCFMHAVIECQSCADSWAQCLDIIKSGSTMSSVQPEASVIAPDSHDLSSCSSRGGSAPESV